jgi:hypothetical protein
MKRKRSNRDGASRAEPEVRIHLPPAASQANSNRQLSFVPIERIRITTVRGPVVTLGATEWIAALERRLGRPATAKSADAAFRFRRRSLCRTVEYPEPGPAMPPPLILLQDISLTFGVTPLLSGATLAGCSRRPDLLGRAQRLWQIDIATHRRRGRYRPIPTSGLLSPAQRSGTCRRRCDFQSPSRRPGRRYRR